jgi:hypothetical protein
MKRRWGTSSRSSKALRKQMVPKIRTVKEKESSLREGEQSPLSLSLILLENEGKRVLYRNFSF